MSNEFANVGKRPDIRGLRNLPLGGTFSGRIEIVGWIPEVVVFYTKYFRRPVIYPLRSICAIRSELSKIHPFQSKCF